MKGQCRGHTALSPLKTKLNYCTADLQQQRGDTELFSSLLHEPSAPLTLAFPVQPAPARLGTWLVLSRPCRAGWLSCLLERENWALGGLGKV